jgi:hypothetical protein
VCVSQRVYLVFDISCAKESEKKKALDGYWQANTNNWVPEKEGGCGDISSYEKGLALASVVGTFFEPAVDIMRFLVGLTSLTVWQITDKNEHGYRT